jgi:predicted metal-dependent HD superfamily phosphohydrolase
MSYERWLLLMKNLGLHENHDTYDALVEAYSESHRYYHDKSHINTVLAYFDHFCELAENKYEIEIALWFHDVIYKPFSSSNEADSADWAYNFLRQNHAEIETQKTVHDLVIATSHSHVASGNDEMLIIDIDLAILGSTEDRYSRFSTEVRQEYKKVPDCIYKRKRRAVLKGFLDRDRIYSHDLFHNEFEERARVNLGREFNQLSGGDKE